MTANPQNSPMINHTTLTDENPASARGQAETLLDELLAGPYLPRATYRVQLGPEISFSRAQELLPYLDALGVSDFYASPLFKPRSTSTHGYDTVDHNQFNPLLGTEDDFNSLSHGLTERGMGLLLDIVPNHMGVSTENDWWTDVLKHGPSSEYAAYFDINWRPPNRAMDDKVLLPVLGGHYGEVLEAGELKVVYWHGDFYIHYYEHQFPMTPESYARILSQVQELLPRELDATEEWVPAEVASIVYSLGYLPAYNVRDLVRIAARQREQTIVRWRLLGLFDKSAVFRTALDQALDIINGEPGNPDSFDTLDWLLSEQPYRLAFWRTATDEINYRRFFDINDMAAVRVENARVFDGMHKLTLRLMAEKKVTGLRIDHPDGLWDPTGYFRRLQAAYLETVLRLRLGDEEAGVDYHALAEERLNALQAARTPETPEVHWPFYVLVEKILSASEPLPDSWAIYGTTGYDFMSLLNNLYVYGDHEAEFNRLYAAFTGEVTPFHELITRTKRLMMTQSLTSEIHARSAELAAIVERNRRFRGFTQNSLAFGLSEFIAALDIYRTYITGPDDVSERDQAYVEEAIRLAKQRNPLVPKGLFDFLQDTLLMRNLDDFTPESREDLREFVMKFQQITGPVMAKSVEDTAFYIYNRLVSLNEVGGHPEQFGASVAEFHRHNQEQKFPHTMLATSTHDTKRSEDVRARISVLSELADEWAGRIDVWSLINAGAKTRIGDLLAPTPNDEYLIYQTLLGTWDPLQDDDATFVARMAAYMHKAINEAKVHSNWINPNEPYAQAITDFITAIWQDEEFRATFDPFQARIAYFGRINSLSQTLLKHTCPGMPDIYQGTELWDFSLVDPDNRRPVDFGLRHALLDELKAAAATDRPALAAALLADAPSGRIKLYLTWVILEHRRIHEPLFRHGGYLPLTVTGEYADHVCAFVRSDGDDWLLTVAPRWSAILSDGRELPPTGDIWGDTQIVLPPEGLADSFYNLLTGETLTPIKQGGHRILALTDVLDVWPVACFGTI
ncbi:MAG: malto-oligosyltrehalose synthase [Caldilineaceae bacterium]|nr:malto-oligosyltrehalose synthase [Caldilineaceae bacterium]